MIRTSALGTVLIGIAIGTMWSSVSGCSDGRPERVRVSGVVLIDGEPLTYGTIMFIHAGERPSRSPIDKDGRFVLSCYESGDGAVLGKHRVKVTAVESIDDRTSKWHAPKKYANAETSGIEVEITEPRDDLTIALTWDGGGPFVESW